MSTNSEQKDHQRPDSSDWLDRFEHFNLHFGRYLRDMAGVLLIAIALMSLLALWGVTSGILLNPWSEFLSKWFGWGSYIIILAIGYGGLVFLRRNGRPLSLIRVLSLELAALLTLGVLAVMGSDSLARAEVGQDGGRLGWGIDYLLGKYAGSIWAALILFVLWLLTVITGFGLWAVFEAWLLKLAGEPVAPPPLPVQKKAVAESPQKEQSAKPAARKKKPAPLPPEFQPSLKAVEKKNEKPIKPIPREEGLPPLNMLMTEQAARDDERTINQTAGMIMKTLSEFGIPATVIGYRIGPSVTQFAVQPGYIKRQGVSDDDEAQQMKVRVAQIAALEKDLTLALSAERLRIEAPVPGKPYVGIEVPNSISTIVRLRPILESSAFHKDSAPLAMALGRDVSGNPLVADLARMPHLLIAGSTGSGKSVCITSLAACFAMNNAPEDLRMVMIDSKMVELLRFNGLPHLYGKVETNIDRIMGVLRWVVLEMEHRYRLLEASHVRDLEGYNRKQARKEDGVTLPRIVVLIDELADLMMSAPDQTEHNLVRLAQMARATGIHLIVATQRPSTDVVTGLIKANFPARLAFSVASSIDSRVILDTTGAETLLGRGDLLFLNPEM